MGQVSNPGQAGVFQQCTGWMVCTPPVTAHPPKKGGWSTVDQPSSRLDGSHSNELQPALSPGLGGQGHSQNKESAPPTCRLPCGAERGPQGKPGCC